MAPTPETRKHTSPTLPALSAEVLESVAWPLKTFDNTICDSNNNFVIAHIYVNSTDYRVHCQWAAHIAALLNSLYAPATPAPDAPPQSCMIFSCPNRAVEGGEYCAKHEAENSAAATITLNPENNTELAQAVTAQLESATLAAQYTAANDARREG